MPIRIPDRLPARETLINEGVMVMDESVAIRQDIRPLHIGLLNLMPNKIATETQIARLIGSSPLQVELSLVRIGSHKAKNTSDEHLISFYRTWEEVRHEKFDGFIITGAPIETLPFEDVTYWNETARDFRLDAHPCPFALFHLLGRDGGDLSFPRRAQASACRKRRSASTGTATSMPHRLILRAFRTISRSPSRAGRKSGAKT